MDVNQLDDLIHKIVSGDINVNLFFKKLNESERRFLKYILHATNPKQNYATEWHQAFVKAFESNDYDVAQHLINKFKFENLYYEAPIRKLLCESVKTKKVDFFFLMKNQIDYYTLSRYFSPCNFYWNAEDRNNDTENVYRLSLDNLTQSYSMYQQHPNLPHCLDLAKVFAISSAILYGIKVWRPGLVKNPLVAPLQDKCSEIENDVMSIFQKNHFDYDRYYQSFTKR